MKIWSVFSLVIVFHLAIIGMLLMQPGCQTQPTDAPDPGLTAPAGTQPVEDQGYSGTDDLDPAFNAGMGDAGTTASRQLSPPRRPEGGSRGSLATGQLESVLEPVQDTLTLPAATREYSVRKGDTLSGIASREGVSLSALMSANGLRKDSTIYVGQTLLIPEKQAPSASGQTSAATDSGNTVVVASGDSLSRLASRHGTTVQAIKSLNGLSGDTIFVGQELRLPAGSGSGGSSGANRSESSVTLGSGMSTYTVKSGDTPSGIARQFGISSRELMAANNIVDARKLFVGQKLVIPRQGAAAPVQSPAPEPAPSRSEGTSVISQSLPPAEPEPTGVDEDPMSALEALEDEELPFVEVEAVEEETPQD